MNFLCSSSSVSVILKLRLAISFLVFLKSLKGSSLMDSSSSLLANFRPCWAPPISSI